MSELWNIIGLSSLVASVVTVILGIIRDILAAIQMHALIPTKKCPRCGMKYSGKYYEHCPKCGTKLEF